MTDQEVVRDIAQRIMGQIKDDKRLHQIVEARIQADPTLAAGKAQYDAIWTGYPDQVTLDEVNEAAELYWQSVYKPTLVQVRLDIVKVMEGLCETMERPFAGPLSL